MGDNRSCSLALVIFCYYVVNGNILSASLGNESNESLFRDFIIRHQKSYAIGSQEYFRRLNIFEANLHLSAKLNSLRDHPNSAWYGVTKFSDMTDDEFKEKYLSGLKLDTDFNSSIKIEKYSSSQNSSGMFEVPKKFDWRSSNIVTEPRDQFGCGSCWAFATVETIESMYAKKTKNLIPLSVQQMVDCSFQFTPSLKGCGGGYPCDAFSWALKTKTVFIPETSYPYAGRDQLCHMRANTTKGPSVTKYSCNNFVHSEVYMLEQISSFGPLSVAVDASNWKNYQGGVIQFHCGEVPTNHAVQIVGYDLTGPIPYYIAKNSWGTDFGHDGYLYIKYGDNVCSIAQVVSTAEVSV